MKRPRCLDSFARLRERALEVVFDHAPEHSLLVSDCAAPNRQWLAIQRRCDGPEIFECFFDLASTPPTDDHRRARARCRALLQLCDRFFLRRESRCVVDGKKFLLLLDGDDHQPGGGDDDGDYYLICDRRRGVVEKPRLARHVVAERAARWSARAWGYRDRLKLESIWCPEATAIETQAFWHCANLRLAYFPWAATVGAYAFGGAARLVALALPAALFVHDYAFFHCSSLTTLYLTEAAMVGDFAFARCTTLTHVVLAGHTAVRASTFVGGLGHVLVHRLAGRHACPWTASDFPLKRARGGG